MGKRADLRLEVTLEMIAEGDQVAKDIFDVIREVYPHNPLLQKAALMWLDHVILRSKAGTIPAEEAKRLARRCGVEKLLAIEMLRTPGYE